MDSSEQVVKREQDCFAYKNGKCKILRVLTCEGTNCSFYKTLSELQMDRQKALEHIQALDVTTRNEIIDLYKLDIEKQFSGVSGDGN